MRVVGLDSASPSSLRAIWRSRGPLGSLSHIRRQMHPGSGITSGAAATVTTLFPAIGSRFGGRYGPHEISHRLQAKLWGKLQGAYRVVYYDALFPESLA